MMVTGEAKMLREKPIGSAPLAAENPAWPGVKFGSSR